MEFNKDEILNSIDMEVRSSFKNLLESVISMLQESVKNGVCIPTREVLKVIPSYGGFNTITDKKPDLYSLIPRKIWDLDEYQQCSEIFDKNELLGSQKTSSNSFLVLPSFIADYLDSINPELIIFDQGSFNSLFDEYKNLLLSLTYDILYICPLFGFESEVGSFKLDEDLTIRKITADERNEIWNMSRFFGSNPTFDTEIINVKYVIEQRVVQIKNSIPESNINLIPTALFAFRLLKKGNFLADIQLHKSLLPWKIKMSPLYGNNYHNSLSAHNKYFLSMNDVEDLRKYYLLSKRVQNLRSKEYKQLSRAIEWFKRFDNEPNIEHQFIFLMLLLEALCSATTETQYRLSTRVSLVIGEGADDRLSIIKNFVGNKRGKKGLYGIRSAIMHGDVIELDTNFYSRLEQAEDYSRRLLQKFILLSLNGHGTQDARKLIDNALVSEAERTKLFEALKFNETYDKLNIDVKKPEPLYIFLKKELYDIKDKLNRFDVYDTNKGFIYKSIVINGSEGVFIECLWDQITKFYDSYSRYLMLLKKSSTLVDNIIQKVIQKIKTETEASEWRIKHLEKVNPNSPSLLGDANGKLYGLSHFLQEDTPKGIPEINDDEYLILGSNLNKSDLKITLEDIRRSNMSIENILQEIHSLVASEDLIREIRDSKAQNLELISNLIIQIDKM